MAAAPEAEEDRTLRHMGLARVLDRRGVQQHETVSEERRDEEDLEDHAAPGSQCLYAD